MGNLIIPEKVTIRLKDNHGQPLPMANVIFGIHLFARHKNDFHLGPYVSNTDGIVVITGTDIQHDVEATYDSGLMDYVSVETCHTLAEIQLETADDIQKALHCRETEWTSLLKGETERWGSMNNLLKIYRQAANSRLNVCMGFSRIRDDWDGSKEEYGYDFAVGLAK
jgi:hypothetical protein